MNMRRNQIVKVIEPKIELLKIEQDPMQYIERIGRICYKSEDKITDESAKKFVAGLIKRNHEAMLEHSFLSIRFICDRGVSHELVRHRLASFAQESTRYCTYSQDKFGNELTFIKPCFFDDIKLYIDTFKTFSIYVKNLTKDEMDMIKYGINKYKLDKISYIAVCAALLSIESGFEVYNLSFIISK